MAVSYGRAAARMHQVARMHDAALHTGVRMNKVARKQQAALHQVAHMRKLAIRGGRGDGVQRGS